MHTLVKCTQKEVDIVENGSNWIKLDRSIREHWLWNGEKYSRGQAFIDLLLMAAYADHKVMSQGKTIDLKRGSLITSIRYLAERWSWSKDKVSNFLCCLEEDNIIKKTSDTKRTVIAIVNYGKYQSFQTVARTQNGRKTDEERTQNGQTKERKEGKEGKRNTMSNSDAAILFERLWEIYPSKKGKGQVSDAKKMKLLEIGFDEMSRAIERYKAELEKDSDWRKPQNGSTFFNSGYVDYLDANYVPQDSKKSKGTSNQFNNFNQREYDYDDLEALLLGTQPGAGSLKESEDHACDGD